MDEPELVDTSGLQVAVLPSLDRDGFESRLVVVKGSWAIVPGAGLAVAEQPRAIRLGDELWGAPEIGDIRLPGDAAPAKPGTDVILAGHAVAPVGQRVSQVDVSLNVAQRRRTVRVHGARDWRRGWRGVVPGAAAPVARVPLAWTLAWGGIDTSNPDRPLEEPRNPLGSGVCADPARLVGTPAPQIEWPDAPIVLAGDTGEPAGLSALGPRCEPRRSLAGTWDAQWLATRYPARPADYREAHEHCAAPGLVFDTPLRGGEAVQVVHVHPQHALAFTLPRLRIAIGATIDGLDDDRRPHLDTVVIDSDALVLELTWRALFRCPARMRGRFTRLRVERKEYLA